MKSVLISVRPKYCKLLADGKKTVEIKKKYPKAHEPLKCYIYCTRLGTEDFFEDTRINAGDWAREQWIKKIGKVIGECICDKVTPLSVDFLDDVLNKACMTAEEFQECTEHGQCYAWHLTDLKIYETPKTLKDFGKSCDWRDDDNCLYPKDKCVLRENGKCKMECTIKYPPQSWQYVERLR